MKKVVLITGASKGLGFALTEVFGKAGYQLVITARDENSLKQLVEKYPDTKYVAGDLVKKDTREQLVDIINEIGRIDVLINSAGIILIEPIEKDTEEDFDNVMNINIKAPLFLTRDLLPTMIRQKSGHIINVSSTAGREGKKDRTIYCASKFAMRGFTESLRTEVKKHGIKVTGFYPGGMKTNLFDKYGVDTSTYMDPKDVADFMFNIVQTKNIAPEDVLLNRMSKNK